MENLLVSNRRPAEKRLFPMKLRSVHFGNIFAMQRPGHAHVAMVITSHAAAL